MLSVNQKNCHLTQRFGVGLTKVERCLIDKTQSIEQSWVQAHLTTKEKISIYMSQYYYY